MVAAALPFTSTRGQRITPSYTGWQNEAWGYYESLGEFRDVVDWKSNLISRVRLRAAQPQTNTDEPTIVDSGVAAEIMQKLQGITGNQIQLLNDLATHLSVPGECFLLGEDKPDGDQSWRVLSCEEIRTKGQSYEILDESSTPQNVLWRDVAMSSLVVRVWRPSKRLFYAPDAPARSALSTMRELELVSRHMQAQYLSRLASAGILLMPDEVAFPVRDEFQDAADPFVQEWIAVAAEAIKTPGAAASVVPIPMRVPSEYIEHFRHIDFTLALDDEIVSKRESVIKRLAGQLDAPPEILLGTGTANHWSAWSIDESAVKAHILPTVEVICWALTIGYLRPQLVAAGEDPDKWVVWYDASEITIRPDRSASAKDAYDRLELSGEALRRESGFDETDKPSEEELREMMLKILVKQPVNAFEALAELTGDPVDQANAATIRDARAPKAPVTQPDTGPPQDTGKPPRDRNSEPAAQQASLEDRLEERLSKQSRATHYIEFNNIDGYRVIHPELCKQHMFSCPFTFAAREAVKAGMVRPGASGKYMCALSPYGVFLLGGLMTSDTSDMLTGDFEPFTRKPPTALAESNGRGQSVTLDSSRVE